MAYPQTTFADTQVASDSLIGRRREAAARNTLLYQLEVLKETGRYDAFKLKWHPIYDDTYEVWPVPKHLFWDSDVAKWIEGACYFLRQQSLPEVESAVVELVQMIKSAQQPDGYLNIHFTVVKPEERFTNLRDLHELYNAGHLIEAALAHNEHFGNNELLAPIIKYVDLLCRRFGPEDTQSHGYPGHPEIELALLRLYDRTKDSKHFDLAKYFILERGNPTGCEGGHFYDVEAKQRGEGPGQRPEYWPEPHSLWYYQAHQPIIKQQTIEGHSVRAMYLLTAAADLERLENPEDLKVAIRRLWDNMVNQKMYVTGGIGAMKTFEGFGQNYFLPQGTDEGGCYSETCAAIGVMMLADRLLKIELHGKYADILELCLYNAVLTAMSSDGKKFTYVNQLASSEKDTSARSEWFTCACCPPNILRMLGNVGGYLWNYHTDASEQSAVVNVHLYVSGKLSIKCGEEDISLEQTSNWPWEGDVKFELQTSLKKVGVRLRVPGWASSWKISPELENPKVENGYLSLSEEWLSAHPTFSLLIPMEPRLISPHPLTHQNTLTLARGPVVYCVEDFDNNWVQDHFEGTYLDPKCEILEHWVSSLEDSYMGLSVKRGAHNVDTKKLKASPSVGANELRGLMESAPVVEELHFIPYFSRANREGRGQMRVGLKAKCW